MLLNIEIDVLIPLYIKYPVLNLNIYLYVSSKLKVYCSFFQWQLLTGVVSLLLSEFLAFEKV